MKNIKAILGVSTGFILATAAFAQTAPDAEVNADGDLVLNPGTDDETIIPAPEGSVNADGNLVIGDTTIDKPDATLLGDGSLELGDGTILPVPDLPAAGNAIADALNTGPDPLYVQFADTKDVTEPQLWFHYNLKAVYDFGDNSGIVWVREMGSFVYMALETGGADGLWAYSFDINGGMWVFLSFDDMTRLDPQNGVDRIEGWIFLTGSVNDGARIAEFDDNAEPGTYIFDGGDLNIRLTTEP